MSVIEPSNDMIDELRYALAGGRRGGDRSRSSRPVFMLVATARRHAGRPVLVADHISWLVVLRRTAAWLTTCSRASLPMSGSVPRSRGLTVQGLVGHLLGVEQGFAGTVRGHVDGAEDDHIAATDAAAAAQRDQPPERTLRDWWAAVADTVEVVSNEHDEARADPLPADHAAARPVPRGARLFEMWIHDEDIRREQDASSQGPTPRRWLG